MDWFQRVGQSRNKFYTYKKLLKNVQISQKIRTKPIYISKFINTLSNRCDSFLIYPSNKCIDRTVISLEDPGKVEWFETYVQCAGYKKGHKIIKKYLSNLGRLLITYQNDESVDIIFPIQYVEADDSYKEK